MVELQPHDSRPVDDREGHLAVEPWSPWQWAVTYLCIALAVAPLAVAHWMRAKEERETQRVLRETLPQGWDRIIREAKAERERLERLNAFYRAEIEKQKRAKGKP